MTTGMTPTASMAGYRVMLDDLSAAASYVDLRSSDIEARIATLGTYVNSLNVYWQGPAHGQFETLMMDYQKYASMLQNALTEIANGLRGNYTNYSAAENTNLGNLAKVNLPPPNFGS
ncbi:MAG TPA: WXG100 family type VII secretion target [Streptosporangiaceae bacterium]